MESYLLRQGGNISSRSSRSFSFAAGRLGNLSKKRQFVADGVFYAELNELLIAELGPIGYCGVEVRNNPSRTEIVIRATRPQDVLGERGRKIRELNTVVEKRFKFKPGTVTLYAERVVNRGLSAEAQAESLRAKLLEGMAVRRACYGVIRLVMKSEAKGVECLVTGKLRGARAKAMKFREGYMIKTGNSNREYVVEAVRHVLLRQGAVGVKVKIMKPHDPEGKQGPKNPLSDIVSVSEPTAQDAPNQVGIPTRRPKKVVQEQAYAAPPAEVTPQ